ncbi:protein TRIGALACTOSYLDIACYLGLYCEROL 5, chloroplastic [Solanum dulcamara]|uniref:protein TRIGALACTOSYLDIACYLGLYCEROL 5, chloroplastic n=1 Tax=Solanum dulcamara TaxID=45834 RepID=UPI002486A1E7|nr:protein TRIGALACTOSYLDIACYLGLYCEROL 5, chloroplastic [Solanum dulcamara]
MQGKTLRLNGFGYRKADNNNSLWKLKGINLNGKNDDKRQSVTEFIQEKSRKVGETTLGPGGGLGIGCGVGVGLGAIGGLGLGGSDWNHLKLVFGVGMGCGVGIGFGYGQGIGVGFSWDEFKSRFFEPKSSSRRPFVIQI